MGYEYPNGLFKPSPHRHLPKPKTTCILDQVGILCSDCSMKLDCKLYDEKTKLKCTCKETCSYNCKGECGCEKCRQDYNDFLSLE